MLGEKAMNAFAAAAGGSLHQPVAVSLLPC